MTLHRLTPEPFQEADIRAVLEGGNRGFVVADTGAGKTLIGAEIGLRSGARTVLVIGVRDTHGMEEWGGTIMRQTGQLVRTIDGTEPGKQAMFDLQMEEPGWYIVTPQMFTRWGNKVDENGELVRDRKGKVIQDPSLVKTLRPDLIIVDEAHLLGNRDSAGGKLLRKHLRSPHGWHVAMSGTIFRNKFENFWNPTSWIYPERNGHGDIADSSFWRWVSTWCDTKFSAHATGGVEILGEKDPGAFAAAVPVYRQHFKRAHCCEFHPPREEAPNGGFATTPPPEIVKHFVDLTPQQADAIAQMDEHYVAWLTDAAEQDRALVAKLPIVAQTRLRQMALGMPSFQVVGEDAKGMPVYEIGFAPGCASPKLDLFQRRLAATGATYLAVTSSEKFAREAVRRIRDDWGYTAELWAGTVSKVERKKTKARFMAGEVQVLVATIEAIGTGVDGLQHVSNRCFWFDVSRDITSNVQLEGRQDRRGQTERVVNEYAIARGSMDQGIMSDQMERRLAINKSLRKAKMKQNRRAA